MLAQGKPCSSQSRPPPTLKIERPRKLSERRCNVFFLRNINNICSVHIVEAVDRIINSSTTAAVMFLINNKSLPRVAQESKQARIRIPDATLRIPERLKPKTNRSGGISVLIETTTFFFFTWCPSGSYWKDGVHPSCDSSNTSRRFALGASNVCLLGENPTCSVPA